MSSYRDYNELLLKSVKYIFKNFAGEELEPILEGIDTDKKIIVSVDMTGSIKGEIIYQFPIKAIKNLLDKVSPDNKKRKTQAIMEDLVSEMCNMITGTFVNHLQYAGHDIEVAPPEILEGDEEYVRSLYESVNFSLEGDFGNIDVDFYYKEV